METAMTPELEQLRFAAQKALLPNDNVRGEWKAKQHGDGPEWMICGPRYASRPSRVVIAVTELDGFTAEEAHTNNKAVAEFIVAAVNAALQVKQESP
jgi:hypothetical protein